MIQSKRCCNCAFRYGYRCPRKDMRSAVKKTNQGLARDANERGFCSAWYPAQTLGENHGI